MGKKKLTIFGLAGVGGLLALGAILLSFSLTPRADDQPPTPPLRPVPDQGTKSPLKTVSLLPLSWTPDTAAITLSPGETKVIEVTANVSSTDPAISAQASVQLSPSLIPYVTVEPKSNFMLRTGSKQVFKITATIPPGTPFQTATGTLDVRYAKTGEKLVQRPLPITLDLWPKLESGDDGVSVHYPPTWSNLDGLIFSNVQEFTTESDPDEAFFMVRRITDANPDLLSIEAWYQQKIAPTAEVDGPTVPTNVSGFPALRFVSVEAVAPYAHILLAVGRDVIWITIANYTPRFETEYQVMVSTLEILP